MDPPTLVNECSFSNANATSFNLSEIWQFPMNGGGASGGDSGGGGALGLRRPNFAQSFAQFGDVSGAIRDVLAGSDPNPMSLDVRGSHGGGAARKRRDAEDESPKSSGHIGGFLSMKLEAVNTRMNPGIEVFPSKDFGQQTFDTAAMAFGTQPPREYSRGSSPEWLHMQIGGGFERT
ncbi:transcription factor bHLH79 [Prunus yedoensis var. nudiflora]|uniref:Transcription factor bHLH79 n=1 Tax=Prunus yedoensis var. nudiflora TaxID=2094558 RepID=A0A314YME7_PRUYE|nr:transcription factor bHLH79 [Prunus yedoensis var. nudiflora]